MPPALRKGREPQVMTMRRLAPRGVLLTIALLLIAQLGAQWHTYAHGDGRSSVAAAHQGLSPGHGTCDDCLGFAPLLAAAGAPAWPGWAAASLHRNITDAERRFVAASGLILAFRSRAPPR